MTTTLDLNRLKDVNKLNDLSDKYIISDNGEIKFVNVNDLVYVFSSSNVVSNFYIIGTNGNILNINNGKVVSPEVNGKQYLLNIIGNKDYTKTVSENNGLVDTIRTVPYEQPVLTSNSSLYFNVTGSSNVSDVYKAFDGFDATSWVSSGAFPQTVTMNLYRPIVVEKFAIKNSSDTTTVMTSFKIEGQDTSNVWHTIIYVDGSTEIVPDKTAGGWNEYTSSDMTTQFKAFRIEIISSLNDVAVSFSRFNIIGNYKGAYLPSQKYNLFVIGKENINNPDSMLISTIMDTPFMPTDYTYGVKIGEYFTSMNLPNSLEEYYPIEDVVSYFNNMRNPY